MNIQPLLDALDIQEGAARALADDLRAQIGDLQTRLWEAETHLEHLVITRKTVTGLADRLPAVAPDLPEHPDYPRLLAVFNEATDPLRARDICEALGHELLPKNIAGTRAKLKRRRCRPQRSAAPIRIPHTARDTATAPGPSGTSRRFTLTSRSQ
ncbi:hypothetical protein [Streptomyces sp. NPDC006463]|uniref:hypothetical protein n=1 Tax=Streptomyces sp. NPDC006463 TaxID=3364746 RepID=UPI003699938A